MPINGKTVYLEDDNKNPVFPITSAKAVKTDDGGNIEDKINEIDSSIIRIDGIVENVDQIISTRSYVNVRVFGAKGDGVTDDTDACFVAHEYANKYGFDVVYPAGKYFLKAPNNIIIQTNVNFGNAEIIIDEKNAKPGKYWFHIFSEFTDVSLNDSEKNEIKSQWSPGNYQMNFMKKYTNKYVWVQDNDIVCIRNNGGSVSNMYKKEQIFVDEAGLIKGDIFYNFNDITTFSVRNLTPLVTISGGRFIFRTGPLINSTKSYVGGLFKIERNNVKITGSIVELENGLDLIDAPSSGIIHATNSYGITIDNFKCFPRSFKNAGSGTYAMNFFLCQDVRINNMTALGYKSNDQWGSITGNYNKDFYVSNTTTNRIDNHYGCLNMYIDNCKLVGESIHVSGKGKLKISNTVFDARTNGGAYFINTRSDYGSQWDGDISINDCKMILGPSNTSISIIRFSPSYSDTHDFGFNPIFGKRIDIDGFEFINSSADLEKQLIVLRTNSGESVNTYYRPSIINIRNITDSDKRSKAVLQFGNIHNYDSNEYYNFEGVCNIKVFKPQQGSLFSLSKHLNPSKQGNMYITCKKCEGMFDFRDFTGEHVVNDSIVYASDCVNGSGVPTKVEFKNSLIYPKYLTDGDISRPFDFTILGGEIYTELIFNNCIFELPERDGASLNDATMFKNDMARMFYAFGLSGTHINSTFTDKFIKFTTDVLDSAFNYISNKPLYLYNKKNKKSIYKTPNTIFASDDRTPFYGYFSEGEAFTVIINDTYEVVNRIVMKSGYCFRPWRREYIYTSQSSDSYITVDNKTFEVIRSGTSGTVAPDFATVGVGETINDGSCVWKNINDEVESAVLKII